MYGEDEDDQRYAVIALIVVAIVVIVLVAWWAGSASRVERDALKATITALREGDGSCAVTHDGPRVVCWMESGSVKVMPLKPGDVIVGRECLRTKRRLTCAR